MLREATPTPALRGPSGPRPYVPRSLGTRTLLGAIGSSLGQESTSCLGKVLPATVPGGFLPNLAA